MEETAVLACNTDFITEAELFYQNRGELECNPIQS